MLQNHSPSPTGRSLRGNTPEKGPVSAGITYASPTHRAYITHVLARGGANARYTAPTTSELISPPQLNTQTTVDQTGEQPRASPAGPTELAAPSMV